MEYYSVIKRNEVLTHAIIWMNLGNFLLSERSLTNTTYCTHFCELSRIGKSLETESRSISPPSGAGRNCSDCQWVLGFIWGWRKCSEISVDSKSVNTPKTTLKFCERVNFVVCELHINRTVVKNNNLKAPLILLHKLLLTVKTATLRKLTYSHGRDPSKC